ncbi:MAG TPA: MFS transporter [Anaerolineae bacterium]|nr:MFS transporter [Anaerolineae bacterium]
MPDSTESNALLLPRRIRRRGLMVLLANTFLMWSGFFMIVPVLSLHYVDDLGWAAASIGLILGIRQLLQQTLTVLGGALADRLGAKRLIVIGIGIRIVAFSGMAWAFDFTTLLALAILAAIGGSLFDAPSAAAIAALTTEEERLQFYSLRGVTTGLGLTVGPLIGSTLLNVDFALIAYVSGACYLVALAITAIFLPAVQVGLEKQSLSYGVRLALRDRPFIALTALLMGYWFMWVQLTISLPLKGEALSGDKSSLGLIYLVNALITICLQIPIVRWFEHRLSPMLAMTLGMTVMAVGLGSIAVAPAFPAMLVSVAVFSVGNLIALTNQNAVIASLARPEARGSYFGVSAVGLAFGGGLGNFLGSVLYGESLARGLPMLPWLIIGAVGLGAALGLWLLHYYLSSRATLAVSHE